MVAERDSKEAIKRQAEDRENHTGPTEIPGDQNQEAQYVNAADAPYIAPIHPEGPCGFGQGHRPAAECFAACVWMSSFGLQLNGTHRRPKTAKMRVGTKGSFEVPMS